MKHSITFLFTLLFLACSTPENKEQAMVVTDSIKTKQVTEVKNNVDTNWVAYTDTVNIGFTVTFKHPQNLFAEHFENGECIGKKIKMVDDGPITTMDCCIWMDDASEGDIKPIDTLIQYDLQKLKAKVETAKDTVNIANLKGVRVKYFDKLDKSKIIKQSIFFTKFDTFFEVANERLSQQDFDTFIKSLKIER